MNPVLSQMHDHRSIRTYTDAAVPDDDIRTAVEAAQCASTSANIQTYCIVQITDPSVREAMVALTGGQEKVRDCGAFFVICADMRRHRLLAARAGAQCHENLESFLLGVVDASLFAQNLLLAFESLGWGGCFIGGLRNDLSGVNSLLNLPPGVYPLFGMTIGTAAEEPWKRPRMPVSGVLFKDAYPSDEAVVEMLGDYDDDMAAYYTRRGASGRRWISQMERFFEQPRRSGDRTFYESQGACLD